MNKVKKGMESWGKRTLFCIEHLGKSSLKTWHLSPEMREITGGRNFLRRRKSKYRGLETRNIPGAWEEEEKRAIMVGKDWAKVRVAGDEVWEEQRTRGGGPVRPAYGLSKMRCPQRSLNRGVMRSNMIQKALWLRWECTWGGEGRKPEWQWPCSYDSGSNKVVVGVEV